MVLVKATKEFEAGVMPSAQRLTAMGRFNEEIAKAGILESGAGLKPSSHGVRVRFSGSARTVTEARSSKPRNSSRAIGSGTCAHSKKPSSGSAAAPTR